MNLTLKNVTLENIWWIMQSWSPLMFTWNTRCWFRQKKSVLVNVFPRILLFICDIHWEHSWTKWTSKLDQVASIYADDIKCRLCRIAHIVNEEKLRIALAAFCNCKRYTGRLKNWFSNTWFPEIKRWCFFYRPRDSILTNTNNGTKYLKKN